MPKIHNNWKNVQLAKQDLTHLYFSEVLRGQVGSKPPQTSSSVLRIAIHFQPFGESLHGAGASTQLTLSVEVRVGAEKNTCKVRSSHVFCKNLDQTSRGGRKLVIGLCFGEILYKFGMLRFGRVEFIYIMFIYCLIPKMLKSIPF